MAITFPSNPSAGDIFTSNGRSWQWDGSVWTGYGVLPDPTVLAVDSTNDRVGIGTTTPDYKLEVDGTLAITNESTSLISNNGSTGREILQMRARTTTGDGAGINLYGDADTTHAGKAIIYSDAGARLTVDGGNVGIGTSSPLGTLDISGDTETLIFSSPSGTNRYRFDANMTDAADYGFSLAYWDGSAYQRSLTLLDNGNVGIGTNAPVSDLHIQKDGIELRLENTATNSAPVIKMYGKRGTGTQIISQINSRSSGSVSIDVDTGDSDGDGSSFFKVSVDGTDMFEVGADARVSLSNITGTTADMSENLNVFGTSNPSMKVVTTDNSGSSADFYIGGARTGSTAYLGRITFQNLANQSTGGNYNTARIESHDPDSNYANGKGVLVFDTANGGTLSEAMRLNEDGVLLLSGGSTTTSIPSAVTNAGDEDGLFLYAKTGNGTARLGMWIDGDSGSGDLPFVIANSSSTITFNVYGDGDVVNTNNSYGQISDASIKQDIVDASSQWDDIKAVQLRNYRLIEDVENDSDNARVYLGVVAQELEAAGMSGLVTTRQNDLKSVKSSVLYMKAVGALQEAQNRIETLEQQNTDLVARIEALEAG